MYPIYQKNPCWIFLSSFVIVLCQCAAKRSGRVLKCWRYFMGKQRFDDSEKLQEWTQRKKAIVRMMT